MVPWSATEELSLESWRNISNVEPPLTLRKRCDHGDAPPSSVPFEMLRVDWNPETDDAAPDMVLLKLEACDRVRPVRSGNMTYNSGVSENSARSSAASTGWNTDACNECIEMDVP